MIATECRKCLWCGTEFEASRISEACIKAGSDQRYCTRKCMKSAKYDKEKANGKGLCVGCGQTFHYQKDSRKVRQWCCLACKQSHAKERAAERQARREQARQNRVCEVCGKVFESKLARPWCGRECSLELQRRKENERTLANRHRVCSECGMAFIAGRHSHALCSDRCRAAVKKRHRKVSKYNRKQRKRAQRGGGDKVIPAEVFNRDGWRCQRCGKKVRQQKKKHSHLDAHVDHILPLSKGGLHAMANVQTLCRACNCDKGSEVGGDQLRMW